MMRTHFNCSPDAYAAARAGHLQRRRHAIVGASLQICGAQRALELGCGPGQLLAELAERFPRVHFWAVEPTTELRGHAIEHCLRLPNVVQIRQVIGTLPAPVDFVCSIDVLHHVQDPLATFELARRNARPGATWIAIEPNIWHPWVTLSIARMKLKGLDEDHFRPWRFEPAMRAGGWAIARRSYAICVPAAVQRLPRWLARIELQLERCPPLAGSVVYELRAV